MKKIIISVLATILVVGIIGSSIFIFTATESKQVSLSNVYGFYSVNMEITDFKRGEKDAEILGIITTYKPSTAKIHIVLTPKDDFTIDGGNASFSFSASHWTLSESGEEITFSLNREGATDLYFDIESNLKISTVAEPDSDSITLTNISGTATYKKFFNELDVK